MGIRFKALQLFSLSLPTRWMRPNLPSGPGAFLADRGWIRAVNTPDLGFQLFASIYNQVF